MNKQAIDQFLADDSRLCTDPTKRRATYLTYLHDAENKEPDERAYRISRLKYYYSDVLPIPTKANDVSAPQAISQPKANDVEGEIRERYGFFHHQLQLTKKSKKLEVLPSRENIKLALLHHPSFAGLDFYHSIFELADCLDGKPLNDIAYIRLANELSIKVFGCSVKTEALAEAVALVTDANQRNILGDWFRALPRWDGLKRLDSWLIDYTGAEDTIINRIIGLKWLISGVSRALNPGGYVEGCLILSGATGIGKSTLFKILCPSMSWFCDTPVSLSDSKRAAETFCGKFIIEMAELDTLRKSDLTATKTFLTQQADTFRAAYAKTANTHPRMQIYAGTTNEQTFLADTTGNRRFWVVGISRVDMQRLKQDRDQLWAEAMNAYLNKTSWTLTAEELKLSESNNEDRMQDDPLAERIGKFITDDMKEITNNELYNVWLSGEKLYGKTVASSMHRLGWEQRRRNTGRFWVKKQQ